MSGGGLMKIKNITLLGCMSLALSYCGKNSDNQDTEYPLVGTWAYTCLEFSSDDSTELRSETYTFSSSTMQRTYKAFDQADTQCQTPIQTMQINATYLAQETTSGFSDLDMDITSVEVIFTESETIDFLNAEAGATNTTPQCGGGFVEGVEKSLVKDDCESANPFNLPYSGVTFYDIYSTSGGVLTLGNKTSLVTDEAQRATELQVTSNLQRQ